MSGDFDIKLCMVNGERLARIEEAQKHQTALLEGLSKCENCKNLPTLTRLKQNVTAMNWLAGVSFVAALGGFFQAFFTKGP
jgi:hypothetical protein